MLYKVFLLFPDSLLRIFTVLLLQDKNGEVNNYRATARNHIKGALNIYALVVISLPIKQPQGWYGNNPVKDITLQYTRRNTTVYTCFVDKSKAFDKTKHALLFDVLLRRGVPSCVSRSHGILVRWCVCDGERVFRWNSMCHVELSKGVASARIYSFLTWTVYLLKLLN